MIKTLLISLLFISTYSWGQGYIKVNNSLKYRNKIMGVNNDSSKLITGSAAKYYSNYSEVDESTSNYMTVYVDTLGNDATGVINNSSLPFATVQAACIALNGEGVIKIGYGHFNSPSPICIQTGMKFIGSGKPTTDIIYTVSDSYQSIAKTSPTMLMGGTILYGIFNI
jgi:hypothetical protein